MADRGVDAGVDVGGDGVREVVEVELPNGTVALVRALPADGAGGGTGEGATKVGALDRFDFAGVAGTLGGVGEAIQAAMAKAKPRTVKVELGIEMVLKSGKLTGLIVEGSGTADLRVTMEWGDGSTGA
jgi:hypothetical protein